MRFIDCFTYFNEDDLLWLRMNELKPLNPIHVIVESSFTHTGDPKPINFNPERFRDFNFIHLVVDDMPNNGDTWANEGHQRDCIMRVLKDLSLNDDDVIFIGDLDEIPRVEAVQYYDPRMNVAGLCMDKYSCYLNLLEGEQNWSVAKLCTYGMLKNTAPNKLRNSGANFIINYAGWHMSFMGGVDKMLEKLDAFAHQEANTATLRDNLQYKYETGQSLWHTDFWKFLKINSTFPKYLQENQHEFEHLIKKV